MRVGPVRERQDDEARVDGWANVLTALGDAARDHRMAARFERGRKWTQQEIDALYEEDWLFARVIDAIPEDATRRWLRVSVDDDGQEDADIGRQVMDRLEELDAPQAVYELMRYDRLDGGACMLLGADDGQDPAMPLDLARVRTVRHLNVLRRDEIQPWEFDADPTSPTFRQPQTFRLRPQSMHGATAPGLEWDRPIHASRVIRLVSLPASKHSPYYELGWGVPLIQRLNDALRFFGALVGHTELGIKDISQGVLGIKGLAELVASEQGNANLLARVRVMNMVASAVNAVLIDTEESYEKRPSTGLAGLDAVLLRGMDILAGAAEIPLSRLFGQPPSGLSTDDASGRRTYYDSVSNKQRRLLNKPIERLIAAVMAEREGPTGGRPPQSWTHAWIPLEEPSEDDDATRRKTEAETDAVYLERGIITETEVRSRLLGDPRCPYTLDPELDLADEPLRPEDEELLGGTRDPAADPAAPAPKPGEVHPATGVPPTPGDVAVPQETLNGAQIKSAMEIVTAVAEEQLPRASGIAMLIAFFSLDPSTAESLMGEVGRGFVAAKPEPPPMLPGAPPTPPGNAPPEKEPPDGEQAPVDAGPKR